MIRALGRADSIFDATLGLAGDALHAAAVLDCDVIGSEASPAVFSLLERALPDLAATQPAAARIQPLLGSALEHLRALGPDSVDAVMFAPMYASAASAAPGYELFREVAVHAPLDSATLLAGVTAARHRVVFKADRGQAPPNLWRLAEPLRGKAVDWYVHKKR